MADSLAQVRADLSALADRLNALAPSQQPLNYLSMSNDVNIGSIIPLADGNSLVYNSTQHAWVNGSAAGSGFPVGPYDDGTYTYDIIAAGSTIILAVAHNASNNTALVTLKADSSGALTSVQLNTNVAGGHVILGNGIGDEVHVGLTGDTVFMDDLPVGDPSNAKQIYVDGSGFVKQSP